MCLFVSVDLSLYCVQFFGPAVEPEVVLGYQNIKKRGRMVGQKIWLNWEFIIEIYFVFHLFQLKYS